MSTLFLEMISKNVKNKLAISMANKAGKTSLAKKI